MSVVAIRTRSAKAFFMPVCVHLISICMPYPYMGGMTILLWRTQTMRAF
jgi:hypothetical protein